MSDPGTPGTPLNQAASGRISQQLEEEAKQSTSNELPGHHDVSKYPFLKRRGASTKVSR